MSILTKSLDAATISTGPSAKVKHPDFGYQSFLPILAICVEAGMIALRRGAAEIHHEDFMEAVQEVQAKKKGNLIYYA